MPEVGGGDSDSDNDDDDDNVDDKDDGQSFSISVKVPTSVWRVELVVSKVRCLIDIPTLSVAVYVPVAISQTFTVLSDANAMRVEPCENVTK